MYQNWETPACKHYGCEDCKQAEVCPHAPGAYAKARLREYHKRTTTKE